MTPLTNTGNTDKEISERTFRTYRIPNHSITTPLVIVDLYKYMKKFNITEVGYLSLQVERLPCQTLWFSIRQELRCTPRAKECRIPHDYPVLMLVGICKKKVLAILSRRCWRFNKWLASTRGCHLHASSFCWVGIRGIYLMFSAVVQPNWHLYTVLTFGWKLFNIKYQLLFYLDPCSSREINFTFPSMDAWSCSS